MDHQKLAALGLALLLVGGFSGASVAKPSSTTAQSQATERPQGVATADALRGGAGAAQQGGQVNLSAVEVAAVEAIRLAAERTDGKPVVARLTTSNGTPVYNVSVLAQNLSVSQVTVDATDATVTRVSRNVTVVDRQFLGGAAFDFAELRNASEAVRLVRNRTTGQVVNVGLRRGELVYGVALRTPEGSRTRALVTATTGPVLGIRTANATTTTPAGS